MNNKIKKGISLLLNIVIYIFIIYAVFFGGLYSYTYNNITFIITLIMLILFFAKQLFNKTPSKFEKKELLLLIFPFIYLIPLIFNDTNYQMITIKYFVCYILYSMDIIIIYRTLEEKTFFKIVIYSVFVLSLFNIFSIFNNYLLNGNLIHISTKYGDFLTSAVRRLYGIYNYPNVTALMYVIAIFMILNSLLKEKNKFNLFIFYALNISFMLTRSNMITYMYITLIIGLLIYNLINKKKELFDKLLSRYMLLLPFLIINLSIFETFYYQKNLVIIIIITSILFMIYSYLLNRFRNKKPLYILSIIFIILIMSLNIGKSLTININNDFDELIYFIDLTDLENNKEYDVIVNIDTFSEKNTIGLKTLYKSNNMVDMKRKEKKELRLGNNDITFKLKKIESIYMYSFFVSNFKKDDKFIINSIKVSNNQINTIIYPDYYLKPSYYVKHSVINTNKENISSLKSRLDIYKDCVKLVKNDFIFGLGSDAFKINSISNNLSHKALEEHSQILKYLVETGIIGLSYYLLLLVIGTFYIIKNIKNQNKIMLSLLFIIIVGSSTFDLTLSYGITYLIMFITFMYLIDNNRKKNYNKGSKVSKIRTVNK